MLDELVNRIADLVADKLRVADPVLSREEAAKYLGTTTRTLDRLASDGHLPRVKFGTRTVFKVSDLTKLIERNSQSA